MEDVLRGVDMEHTIYIDYFKAFDTVNHEILLLKLI